MVDSTHAFVWVKSRIVHQGWRYGGNALPSEMIALEPRVMLDGAAAVAAVAEATEQPEQNADNAAADNASADHTAQAANSESDNGGNNSESADTGDARPTNAQSVIIVDASVQDAQTLLTGIDPSAHVFYLNAGSDGIQQITYILAGLSNVSELHILSHGSTGSVTLGATTLDTSNIESYASQFVDWDVALSEGADILLYGCNVGQDDTGMDFIDLFAGLTNSDVAASSDLTGSADLGGNWQLEVGTGPIEATSPLSETARNAYDHVLAPPVLTNFGDTITFTEDGNPRRVDGNVQVSDAELDILNGGDGDYDGAGFVLERTGGGIAEDVFRFSNDRGVRIDGTRLIEIATGNQFGTISLSSGTVTVAFNSIQTPATTALVNGTMQSLFYSNQSDTPPSSVTLDLTFTDSDGTPATGANQMVVDINAIDDATTVTDLPASLDFTEDTPLGTFDISASTFADVDSASISVTIEVAAGGTFTLVDSAGLITIAGDGTSTITLTGAPADINTYLDTPANVRFSPPLNLNGAPAATATVTADGGSGPVSLGTIDLNIAPVADDPDAVDDSIATDADLAFGEDDGTRVITAVILGNDSDPDTGDTLTVTAIDTAGTTGLVTLVGGVVRYDPNGAFGALAAGATAVDTFTYTISDGNGRTDTATVTITVNGANDKPDAVDDSVATDADLAFGEDDGVRAITADILGNDSDPDTGDTLTVTAIDTTGTTGLVTLVGGIISYDPNGAFEALAAGASAVDTFTYTVSDGNGGSDTATVTITVNGANDAPVNTVPGPQATNEDVALVFSAGNFNQLSIADVDAAAGQVATVLNVVSGTLAVTTGGGANIVGDGTNTVTITGTVAQVNAALAGVTYTSLLNFNGADRLTVTTNDGGNIGTGGALMDIDTVDITVNPVNDAPVNTVPGPQATNEDVALVFSAGNFNQLSIADVDAAAGQVATVLNVVSGTLAVTTGGGANIVGDGTNTVTITGTVAQVNAALATVTYSTPFNFNGADTLTVTTNDGGNTGAGGALSDIDTVAITVNPVNDAPINSIPGPQTTDNDIDLVFSDANGNLISISDIDAGAGTITTTLLVPSGSLTTAAGSGATIAGNGSATVTISGTIAQVNAALSVLTFTPDGLALGTIALTMTTRDNGNTGGGNLSDTDQISIDLASGLDSTGNDGRNPSDPTGQSNGNRPSNFDDTPGNPIGFQSGNPGQEPLLGGLPGFGGGRQVDDIITAGIGDRTSGENGVSESDLPGNIDLHPTSDTGFSNLDNTTGDATPLLTGKAPADTIVTIKSSLGGILGTVTADENGQWRFNAPSLSDGVHELIATPKDEDGKEGVPSIPLLVTIDTLAPDTPPAPTMVGDVDQLRSDDTPTFTGKAEPGARIVLTSDPDGIVGEVIADENGNWQVTTGPLSENPHQLSVTATDAAGNTSSASPALELVVRGEDDTALNFDATSPVLVNVADPDGSLRFEPINITALLSGFTDQVDHVDDRHTAAGERANSLGFMRQLQKAGNTVNDQLLTSL